MNAFDRIVGERTKAKGTFEDPITSVLPSIALHRLGRALDDAKNKVRCQDYATEEQPFGRFDSPRQLAAFVGLVPSEYSTGPARRLGAITKTGNGRARRALIEAAWAYRPPAKVSQHIQTRIDVLPKPIQDIGWKAQVRLCKRFRRLVARGKHPNGAVTAIARELIAFMWAIAKEVPITT